MKQVTCIKLREEGYTHLKLPNYYKILGMSRDGDDALLWIEFTPTDKTIEVGFYGTDGYGTMPDDAEHIGMVKLKAPSRVVHFYKV